MIMKNWKHDLFTIPNLLSFFRLILIPVYVVIYLNAESNADYFVAAAILAVSCLTDLIDGKIARHFNMISTIGKVLDPFADKVTQFTLIICLTIRYPILLVLVCLFFIKEVFQLIAGIVALRKGLMLTGALLSGKLCTTVLFLSLIILVLIPNIGETAVLIITVLDCIFLIIAFVDYARAYYLHTPMIQSVDTNDQNP